MSFSVKGFILELQRPLERSSSCTDTQGRECQPPWHKWIHCIKVYLVQPRTVDGALNSGWHGTNKTSDVSLLAERQNKTAIGPACTEECKDSAEWPLGLFRGLQAVTLNNVHTNEGFQCLMFDDGPAACTNRNPSLHCFAILCWALNASKTPTKSTKHPSVNRI